MSRQSELKRFVQRNFKGVATKYLNNYVVYHNFVNFTKGTFSDKLNILQEYTFTTETHIKCNDIRSGKAVPVLRNAA